jgi:hypothetical protein
MELSEAEAIVSRIENAASALPRIAAGRARRYRATGLHTMGYKAKTIAEGFAIALFGETMAALSAATGVPARTIANVLREPARIEAMWNRDGSPNPFAVVLFPRVGQAVTPSTRHYW